MSITYNFADPWQSIIHAILYNWTNEDSPRVLFSIQKTRPYILLHDFTIRVTRWVPYNKKELPLIIRGLPVSPFCLWGGPCNVVHHFSCQCCILYLVCVLSPTLPVSICPFSIFDFPVSLISCSTYSTICIWSWCLKQWFWKKKRRTPLLRDSHGRDFLVLCVCFVDRCLSFRIVSLGHCSVCSTSFYEYTIDIFKLFRYRNSTKLASRSPRYNNNNSPKHHMNPWPSSKKCHTYIRLHISRPMNKRYNNHLNNIKHVSDLTISNGLGGYNRYILLATHN